MVRSTSIVDRVTPPRRLRAVFLDFMDIDGDGRILYKEFVKLFTSDDVKEFFRPGFA